MNRLKLFAHVFIQKTDRKIPMKALIELSHPIIAESDSVFNRVPGGVVSTLDYGMPSFLRGRTSYGAKEGDYEHYVNALRHLQRRVTI